MRVFEIPMLAMSLLGFGLLSSFDIPAARADFTFGAKVNLRSVIPVIDPTYDTPDCVSYDGLEMYICSLRPDFADIDIWVLKRASTTDAWGPPENLGPVVNSAGWDLGSCISADGLTLYFSSNRPGGYGDWDIYMTTRATKNSRWGPAVNLGPEINSPAQDNAWVSPNGLELYVGADRPGGYGGGDLYVARRATTKDPWGALVNLGPVVNSAYNDGGRLSPDGLVLFMNLDRPGGYGNYDIWISRRASLSGPWQAPVNLGPKINSTEVEAGAKVLWDGRMLWWFGNDFENWQAPILPIVDFNADMKIDLVDLVMLIDNWGTNRTLCDIGPMPWGDGKVDIEDLKVFMTHYEKENPPKSQDGK